LVFAIGAVTVMSEGGAGAVGTLPGWIVWPGVGVGGTTTVAGTEGDTCVAPPEVWSGLLVGTVGVTGAAGVLVGVVG